MLELVVTVSVWFVSVLLVLSVVLSVSLDELAPVILLPVSSDVTELVFTSRLVTGPVWLTSVSWFVLLLWLVSLSE
jgi:hypothetical protein